MQPPDEPGQHELFGGVARDQRHRMHGPLLPDSIDASDPLLEARRIPWQLVVDDEPAPAVKVEPLRRGVGCQEQSARSIEPASYRITVLGRQKQIIIRGGRNIDVNEVEAAVARIPSVTQVCVVPLPDEMLGERVAALVVSTGTPLGLAEVTDHLASAGFPRAKWPEFVFDVPDLPQNRVGKLSRPDALRMATELHGVT